MTTNLDRIRHSASHILAMAAIRLFPDTKIGIGPVTKEGYYYDFEFPSPITWEDVKRIETEMMLIIQEGLSFTQIFVPEQAFDILLNRGQIFKAELLRDLPDEEVSFFKTGEEFIDLCRGPHVSTTSDVGTLKLTSLSGAYWRGDQNRPQLQRISGTAFETLADMKMYLDRQEAIKGRDFRKLGKTLNLTLGGHRNVTFTPGGTLAIRSIEDKMFSGVASTQAKEIISAPVRKINEIERGMDEFFSHKNRSYKELPVRVFGASRHELTESINIAEKEITSITTLTYKSYFETEDAQTEIRTALHSLQTIFKNLDIECKCQIIASSLESEQLQFISDILQRSGVSQTQIIDANSDGISIHFLVVDSLGREWTLVTCKYAESDQEYISKQGEFTPADEISFTWIIEKVLAYFIEDQEGVLPMWLAPVQIQIIPITDSQQTYASSVEHLLDSQGYRVEIDTRSETMQSKIRDAELERVPVIMVIGEKEEQNHSVSLRLRNNREIGLVSQERLLETMSGI